MVDEELVEVVDGKLDEDMSLGEFVCMLESIHGFMAAHVAYASKLLYEMVKDSEVIKFLAFTGNLIATGLRGIIAQMVKEGFVDVIITTCGAIDHDVARAMGGKYYRGEFEFDDIALLEKRYHRLGNVFIPFKSYGETIEVFVRDLVPRLVKIRNEWGVYEILKHAGKAIKDENSILKAAAERDIPVFVPGIVDGAFGTQLYIQSQFHNFKVNLFKDLERLAEIVFKAKKSGALILGGGISKHHTIWWNQFKDGLDYAVYVTTAVEYDGSLSGAKPREAITWGKLSPKAKYVTVYGDATILLPIIYAGAKYYIKRGK